jgi:hypothetical protein
MGRWSFRAVLLLLGIAGFLAGIIALGQWSLEQMRGRERYLLPFRAIDCQPPPGSRREEFLEEVQYHARLPDRLDLLDEELGATLTQAFQQHPWVRGVAEIRIQPPRKVQVQLTFRRPVLAVPVDDVLRAVDGQGILLPRKAPTEGLPIYDGKASPPSGPEGTPWGDAGVAGRAHMLQPKSDGR